MLNTGKSVYNVKLKVADLALDEVVVIGYGTAKKGNVTGSIATLKGEKVADRQNEKRPVFAARTIGGRGDYDKQRSAGW